jgi:CRISPR/Cas system CSM-associated protein Csm2 small subunit
MKINVKQFNNQFKLTKSQIRRFYEWQETLPPAYFGADSNGITISFPQCSLGYIVKAKRREGEEIDLTEWENF